MRVGECDTSQWLLGGGVSRESTYSFFFETHNTNVHEDMSLAEIARKWNKTGGMVLSWEELMDRDELDQMSRILNRSSKNYTIYDQLNWYFD